MNASELITKDIASITDWRGPIYKRLRELVLEVDPEITEEWKWNTAVWSHNGNVCAVGAFKDHVKMNFFKGALLKDVNKMFNAGLEAKTSRGIDFHQGDTINEPTLKDLVHEAVAYNISTR